MTVVEGIGPKINEILQAGGVKTYSQLANAKVADIKAILVAAGNRYKMHDPGTWPKQAKLAASGDWDALDKLKDELDGGK